MPEFSREARRAPLSRTFGLVLVLLLAAGVGSVGCKKKPVETEPAEPATTEPAQPVDRQPGATSGRSTEVPDDADTFRSQGLEDDDVTRGELSADELKSRLQDQLRTVFFGYDQSDLSETTRRVLEANAKVLSLNPDHDVVIEGHCDERGTIEYNLALGQRRAESVREYLISLGVSAERLRTVSYGEERPVDPGHGESAWSRNRRAAFVVE